MSATCDPLGGSASNIGQTVDLTPTPGSNGPASFRYTVRDRFFMTGQATVSFTMVDVDDSPVIDGLIVPEGTTVEATSADWAAVPFTPPRATDPDMDE